MIAKIAGVVHTGGAVTVTLCTQERGKEKKRRYEVDPEDFESIGSPSIGDEVYDGEISVIIRKTERREAYDRALKILAMGDNSLDGLSRKLQMRGFSRESAEYAAAEMQRMGYIRESDQLQRLIDYNVNKKLMGKRKLIPYLVSKGYSQRNVCEAIDLAIDGGVIDFDRARKELLKTAKTDDPMQIRKILYNHGF